RSLAIAGDGSVWVAVRSDDEQVPSRVDRIAPPPPERSGGISPALLPTSVELPKAWRPVLLTSGDPTTGNDPGFLYVLADHWGSDDLVLACVWVNPKGSPRKFPTPRGSNVSVRAELALGSVPTGLLRAADGSVWGIGSDGFQGWMFHHPAGAGNTQIWHDP